MEPSPAAQPPAVRRGIGGWLLVPALALAVQPLMLVVKYRDAVAQLWRVPGRFQLDAVALAVDLVVLLAAAFVARFYFTCRRVAPALYVLYAALASCLWALADAFAPRRHAPVPALLFLCLVVVPYLTLSRRVADTFVSDLDETHRLERPVRPLAPRLEAFYLRLRGLRWRILGVTAVFLVVLLLACALLRAALVLGDAALIPRALLG